MYRHSNGVQVFNTQYTGIVSNNVSTEAALFSEFIEISLIKFEISPVITIVRI